MFINFKETFLINLTGNVVVHKLLKVCKNSFIFLIQKGRNTYYQGQK